MARVVKFDNSKLKRLERKEQKRLESVRNKRIYYLIVCEGEKTEPNYFEELKGDLPHGVLSSVGFKIDGEGKNTTSLVDAAEKTKNRFEQEYCRVIDRVWVIFDRDSCMYSNQSGLLRVKNLRHIQF